MRIAVIGAGVFGLATAIELAGRNHKVTVFDQGTIPYENASSTDVAKAMRRTWYAGDNGTYVELAEQAATQWKEWEAWSGDSFYHQTGEVVVLENFTPGEPMYESVEFLRLRGAAIEVMSPEEARCRFSQFRFKNHEVCVFDPWGAYIESSRAVSVMAEVARGKGAQIRENTSVRALNERSSKAIVSLDGRDDVFDMAVVAIGAWVERLLPQIGANVKVTHQEMLLIEPRDPAEFVHGVFPKWGIDPDGEGWYGFPLLRQGYLKIAKEPLGDTVDPDSARSGTAEFAEEVLTFLRERIPELAEGNVVAGRSCLYTATPDDHFIIDRVPGMERLFVAGGGSGHGFKFGGSIGPIIADVLEDKPNSLSNRFRIGDRFKPVESTTSPHSRGFARPSTRQ